MCAVALGLAVASPHASFAKRAGPPGIRGRTISVQRVEVLDGESSLGVLPGSDAAGFLREIGRLLFPALEDAGKRVHIVRSGDPGLDAIFDEARVSSGPRQAEAWVTTKRQSITNLDLNVFVDASGRVGVTGYLGVFDVTFVGVARRPGIVTPGDIVATLLHRLGVDPKGIPGVPLRERDTGFDGVALRARLERDRTYGPGIAWAAVLGGFCAIALAAFATWRAQRTLARRAAFATALVPVGFLVGTFVPSGSAWVRAIPIGVALIVGLALKPASDRAFGWVGLGTALAICALAVAAALRPGGEPALSLWGNPLTSWRLFGLRNMFVAFIAGGIVLAAGARILHGRWLVVTGVTTAVIVGAPTIGANFGGVLTLVVALVLTVALRDATRLRWSHLVIAGGAGVLSMGVALASDSGSPVSHGGRAVQSVGEGGVRALADILGGRWRLNVAEITDLGAPGYLGVLIVVGVLVALVVWGARNLPGSAATAVLGGAVAGIVAVAIEDSGFFTGGIIAMFPALVWLVAATEESGRSGPAGASTG